MAGNVWIYNHNRAVPGIRLSEILNRFECFHTCLHFEDWGVN